MRNVLTYKWNILKNDKNIAKYLKLASLENEFKTKMENGK